MPLAVSHTRLQDYRACPQLFRWRHLDHVPAEVSPYLLVGRLVHEIAAKYVAHCQTAGTPSDPTRLEQITVDLTDPHPDIQPDVEDAVEGLARLTIEPSVSYGIEEEFAFTNAWEPCAWTDRAVFFRSKIDYHYRNEAGLRVIFDFKSDQKLASHDEVAQHPQLPIYAWVLSLAVPEERFVAGLYFTRLGVLRTAPPFERPQLTRVRDAIEAQAALIDADKRWLPQLGPHCTRCPYTRQCRAFQSALKLGSAPVLQTDEEAREEAQRRALLQKDLKDAESRLRAWAEVHGPIPVGEGEELGFHPKTQQVFGDVEAVVRQLLTLGVPREAVWGELSLSKAAIERLLKGKEQRPQLGEVLRMAHPETRTEFSVAKIKE